MINMIITNTLSNRFKPTSPFSRTFKTKLIIPKNIARYFNRLIQSIISNPYLKEINNKLHSNLETFQSHVSS